MSEGARPTSSRLLDPRAYLILQKSTVREARERLVLARTRPLLEARAMPANHENSFLLLPFPLDPRLLLYRVDALNDALRLVLYGLAKRFYLVEAFFLGRMAIIIRIVHHAFVSGIHGHLP